MFKVGDKVKIARHLINQNELYYDYRDEVMEVEQVITSEEHHPDFSESDAEELYTFKGYIHTFYRSELEKVI